MPEAVDPSQVDMSEKLKSTLWYHVGQLVDEDTINHGMNATPQFIGSLTELVWAQLGNVATDLEAFAQHAGRTKIRTDDVLLLARRNEGLEGILKQKITEIEKANEEKAREKDRARNS